MKTYAYEISGTGGFAKAPWQVSGAVTCEWGDAFNVVMRQTFEALTEGRAGQPGRCCGGPYEIDKLTITRVVS